MSSLILVLAQWFEWLRWAGVAYLIYLGIQQWRAAPVALDDVESVTVRSNTLFWQGVLVSATNPKTLFFYAAFFPQFIDAASPPGPQLALLCITFLVVATVLDGTYAVLAGQLRPWLRDRRRARLRNRLTGTFLIAAALPPGLGRGAVLRPRPAGARGSARPALDARRRTDCRPAHRLRAGRDAARASRRVPT